LHFDLRTEQKRSSAGTFVKRAPQGRAKRTAKRWARKHAWSQFEFVRKRSLIQICHSKMWQGGDCHIWNWA